MERAPRATYPGRAKGLGVSPVHRRPTPGSRMRTSHPRDSSTSVSSGAKWRKRIEPPSTDPYARWCGRGAARDRPYPDWADVSWVAVEGGEAGLPLSGKRAEPHHPSLEAESHRMGRLEDSPTAYFVGRCEASVLSHRISSDGARRHPGMVGPVKRETMCFFFSWRCVYMVQSPRPSVGVVRRWIILVFAGWLPHDTNPSGDASVYYQASTYLVGRPKGGSRIPLRSLIHAWFSAGSFGMCE